MAVFDLFSKRKLQVDKAGHVEVYHYDALPAPLRVQIYHVCRDAIGIPQDGYSHSNEAAKWWEFIHNTIAREKGVFELHPHGSYLDRCMQWFGHASTDDALDMIELSFRVIDRVIRDYNEYERRDERLKQSPDDAINELNTRFREHAVGFQFVDGSIIRIDSQFVHAEAVKPALALLGVAGFEKASEDFHLAHQHYREGKHKDCIVACQRAFESTLKAVCTSRRWSFNRGDRATELIKVVHREGLFPSYLETGFDTYVAMLKTGLPEIRNNAGGHEDAPDAPTVPSYIASYALHMTATNVVMLCDALKALR
ncbi:MAG TPA: HEPN domain-containing protein [Acetobacteraceae bacterium]|nr:HEPN domain-containing protein [Acetobacteraceae bacterium]